MNIKETAKEVHEISRSKGFYDSGERNIAELLMLITCEVAEACEADRKGKHLGDDFPDILEFEYDQEETEEREDSYREYYDDEIKGSFEEEIADTVIRLLDLAEYKKIDLEWHIKAKIRYNKSRPYKHGKKY